ncbi:MAG: bacterial regulatory, tetR family protein [Rhizobacter sp.]|nr:bacterial regulatory, tetR family protein [Rhizobacter sp.]
MTTDIVNEEDAGDGKPVVPVRQRMIQGAVQLLASKGLQATSFSEVIALTGAPRGSLYHHFPDGKDQLVASAVDMAGGFLLHWMEAAAGGTAEAVTQHFLQIWRVVLERSGSQSGCAVLAVTVATDSADLMAHAVGVFRSWRQRLAELLAQGGLNEAQARRFAVTLIAATEGAVVLSRAERSTEAFEAVAQQMLDVVRGLSAR